MKTYLRNGWILTGEADMEAIGGKCIVIEDGKIAAIMDEVQNVSDGEIIDLKGKYIMRVSSICMCICQRAGNQRKKNPILSD